MPDVASGYTDDEGNPIGDGPPDFSAQLAEAAARGPRATTGQPTEHAPWNDKSSDIAASVATADDGVLTKDVQAGLDAGAPRAPEADTSLANLPEVTIEGEKFTGAQVAKALEEAATTAEELQEQADFLDQENAVETYLDAVEAAGSDGGALVAATVNLNTAVEAGIVSLEEAGDLIRGAILDAYNVYPEDVADDPELAQTIEDAYVELVSSASQVAELQQAREDREAAEALVGPAAEARAKQVIDVARRFGRETGFGEIGKDAAATRAYNDATVIGEELYIEKVGLSPEDPRKPLDQQLWLDCLHAASAAEVEADRAERTHAFHKSFLGTDFSEGYTINGVKQDPRELPEPELDERRVVARAAMRHSSAAEIKRGMLEVEDTSVEAGLRQGRS